MMSIDVFITELVLCEYISFHLFSFIIIALSIDIYFYYLLSSLIPRQSIACRLLFASFAWSHVLLFEFLFVAFDLNNSFITSELSSFSSLFDQQQQNPKIFPNFSLKNKTNFYQ